MPTRERPIFDFDNAGVKRMAKRMIDQAEGLYWWEMTKCRDQRSLKQNSYMWSTVYAYVAKGLEDAWGEKNITIDEAHMKCRELFLQIPHVDRRTGEVTYSIGSTAGLSKPEFSAYLDKIILWAADYLNVEIPAADPNWRLDDEPEYAGIASGKAVAR